MNDNTTVDRDSVQRAESAHREAMEFVDAAFLAGRSGNVQKEGEYNRQALEKEREAANAIHHRYDLEPSRSVLYRSAATLAFRCDELREAERLVACALASETVPSEIAEELRDLMQDVNCFRHHQLKGIELQPNELQFSMEGPAVGHGLAQVDLFNSRVTKIKSLLNQTMSRLLNPDSEASLSRAQSNAQSIFLSVPVAASYAISFRLGTMQDSLPGIDQSVPGLEFSAKVIDEFMTCIEFVNGRNLEGLRDRISNEEHSRKFYSDSKEIAPDGVEIHSLGFTTTPHAAGNRTVAFITPKSVLQDLDIGDSTIPSEGIVEIQGLLLEANATKQKIGSIQIIDSSEKKQIIQVPRESISEIVREMFGRQVTVSAKHDGSRLFLINGKKSVRPCDEP